MAKDYDILKKHYGEKFAQFCRANFPTILDRGEGVLAQHIMNLFTPNKSLYEDLIANELEYDFKSYVQAIFSREKANIDPTPELPPDILMKKAQQKYTLYLCETVADVERFKEYYRQDEKLCTFNNVAGRLERCHVFFAVSDNADKLKRKDFQNPRRQDEYGTSVISLQFNKGEYNDVSIKNRYNHSVDDPDATFSNDLENIYPGLTDSFAQHYGFNFHPINSSLNIPGYTTVDGKMYKYNVEWDAIYYCPDNIIIKDGRIMQVDKSSKILVGNYIFDIHNKQITQAFPKEIIERQNGVLQTRKENPEDDAFISSFDKIVKMDVIKGNQQGSRIIKVVQENGHEVLIEIDKNNDMISYINNNIEKVGDNFLDTFKNISNIQMDKLRKCGYNFAYMTKALKNVNLPSLEICNGGFLYNNPNVLSVNLPKLKTVGWGFLHNDKALTSLSLPKLETCGKDFLDRNTLLNEIDLPKLKTCRSNFLSGNTGLRILTLSNLRYCGDNFLRNNFALRTLRVPKLESVGANFCMLNTELASINIPQLKEYQTGFLECNYYMRNEILKHIKSAVFVDNAIKNDEDMQR